MPGCETRGARVAGADADADADAVLGHEKERYEEGGQGVIESWSLVSSHHAAAASAGLQERSE